MKDIIIKANKFATERHKSVNHVRKYTGEDYIVHPVAVAKKVQMIGGSDEMICAALLHDTVEDTNTLLGEIEVEFGNVVAELVEMLTDVATMEDGNRATRMQINLEHTAKGNADAHTIKLADLIDNSQSIIKHDRSFAKLYIKEKKALMAVLNDGNQELFKEATDIIEAWEMKNE